MFKVYLIGVLVLGACATEFMSEDTAIQNDVGLKAGSETVQFYFGKEDQDRYGLNLSRSGTEAALTKWQAPSYYALTEAAEATCSTEIQDLRYSKKWGAIDANQPSLGLLLRYSCADLVGGSKMTDTSEFSSEPALAELFREGDGSMDGMTFLLNGYQGDYVTRIFNLPLAADHPSLSEMQDIIRLDAELTCAEPILGVPFFSVLNAPSESGVHTREYILEFDCPSARYWGQSSFD